MRVYTIEQKQSQTTLQANLKVVLSISCDTSSNSYSSKNTVNIDESKIKSIKIGGNFIAYLTIDGQVFAVYYNVKENTTTTSTLPSSILDSSKKRARFTHDSSGKPDRMKHRKRPRVDSLLSDLLREYSSSVSQTEESSVWSSSPASPTKTESPKPYCPSPSFATEKSVSAADQAAASLENTDCSDVEQDTQLPSTSEVFLSDYYSNIQSQARSEQSRKESKMQSGFDSSETKTKPEVSQPVQWANSRDNSLYFTMIAATKCAVLLVCSNGQLWRWDMLDNTFEEHPLYKLYCGDKAVVRIHSSNLRITVLLETGEIAAFYDNFTSGISQPMIISELSHTAEHIAGLENETVVDIKSGDFISSVLTKSGKILWWGMLQKEVSGPSKAKSALSSSSIKSGCQVVLKNKANDILIGSLVYTAYPQSKLGRVEGCSGNSVIVRLCDRTSSPSAEKPKVETWSNSQIVVLETTIVPLGTVIGLHGTNAIIMTSRHTDPQMFRSEWKQYRRMFSEGQLDKLDEDVEMEPKKENENVMEIDGSSVASDSANSAYPNLCVYPVSDLEVYESCGHSHDIQKTPVDLLASKTVNLQDYKALSFSIDHTGNLTVLARHSTNNNIYMLTKDCVSEHCEAIREPDSGFLSDVDKMSMLSTPDVVMVLDNNSVPFVPPLPTSLNFREFNYLPSLNAIDIKQEISTIPGRSRLIVAIAKQPQVIMPVVLQGDLKYLSHIQQQEQNTSNVTVGKRPYGKSIPTWSELVRALETERDACGRSCLHVCAIAKPNPLRKQQKRAPSGNSSLLPIRVDDSYFHSITLIKRTCSFEELRYRHYTVERQKELKEHDRWLNVMRFICNIETLDLAKLLVLTDNAGYTPFIAAIASKNYNNAWYLLPIIMKLDRECPGLMDKAVWKTLQYNTTVYHILAQGLLHSALIIQQIPTWCTEQTLQNLFCQKYSSIYKVIIQQKPKNMVKSVKRLFDTNKPMTVRDRILRSFMRGPSGSSSNSTSQFKYSSKQQQGIIFFSDPQEARKALIQMDGYVIPAKANNQRSRTSYFLSNSNPGGFFEVSVRFVAREVRGFFLTPSKKKTTRVKEEFELTQENYRRMLAEALLKDYTGSVNDLCETPLATFVNESIYSKLEDRKKNEKGFSSEHLLPSHRIDRSGCLRDTSASFPYSVSALTSRIPVTVRRPRLSQRLDSHRSDIGDRYSTNSNSAPALIPTAYFYSSLLPDDHTIDRLIVNRRRAPEAEVASERANFSISSSDIEEEETSVTLPPLPPSRYFEELQEDLARVREDELELRRRAGPSTDIFGNHVGTQSSGWGDIRQSAMSDDLFLPFENLIEEDLAYALTVLPSSSVLQTASNRPPTALPSSSSTLPSSSSTLPSSLPSSSPLPSSSGQSVSPPLVIKSENKSDKQDDFDSLSSYPDQKQTTSLDCVAKQLCANELVVVTTIYCCYSYSKSLPLELKREMESDNSPKPKTESESRCNTSQYSLEEIESTLDRVDNVQYSTEMTSFIHNLLANTTNGPDITATLAAMLGRKAPCALFISMLFIRSLVKYLTLQLTNIGPRECLTDMPEYRLAVETKKLLESFGWLSVREILQSAEALFLPIQYNTFKSQTHSSVMEQHIFPNPPGFMFPSSASQAISLHPSTYMRQCPLLKDRNTSPKIKKKLSLVAEPRASGGDEDVMSGDELTDEESVNDESSHSFLTQINIFDVVDNFFNPNPPQVTQSEEDPYLMWAVDGQTTAFRPVFRTQHSAEEMTLLRENSSERGKNTLSCVFSRLVKSATDIAASTTSKLCESVKPSCEETLQASWSWLEPIVTSLESQFVKAREFDLERYSTMLKQGERKIRTLYNPGSMSKSSITASFSQEYVMYLLDSHTTHSSTSLPILDIKSYKHIVYMFDTMFYVISNWPRAVCSSSTTGGNSGKSAQSSGTFLKRSPSLDFGQEGLVVGSGEVLVNKDLDRPVDVQLPLALQPHLLTPMASRETLFSSVCTAEKQPPKHDWKGKESLKQALKKRSKLLKFSAPEFMSQFESTTRVFSTYYLGEGPGIEKDSVLNLKACYSGKTARFVRQIKEVKLLVQSQNRQEMRDLPPRIYNLHIYINRNRLLSDSIKALLEMSQLHPVNYSVKFEGEEGGGPGVNRGWFSVVCSSLRDQTKYPDKTLPLFHCPGRLPEQADNMAPLPWDCSNSSLLYKQRVDGFRACGRFLGLALWFKQTLPIKLCRHVWKYLLGRRLCWADLAFYNSDLYEGLRAMLNDAKWMTEEEFVEVYPCTFEVEVNGRMRELRPGGSQIPLTKLNVEEYIQGYSEQLMVHSVVEELAGLKQGFTDIIPPHVLAGLTAEDLTLLLSGGCGDIPFEKLCSIITFVNSIGCSQKRLEQFKRWFWKIVKDMTQTERQQLLYFATGSSTLPPLDHNTERSRDRISITVDIQHDSRNALPMASTCGQRISIPLYRSFSMLKSKLSLALQCLSYGLG
ncbi:hypothetical protein ACHWQZ_G015469 [Mnemiopsis leidyi]